MRRKKETRILGGRIRSIPITHRRIYRHRNHTRECDNPNCPCSRRGRVYIGQVLRKALSDELFAQVTGKMQEYLHRPSEDGTHVDT